MSNNFKRKSSSKRNKKNKFDYYPKCKPSFMCVRCRNVIVDEKAKFNENQNGLVRKYCPFCDKVTKMVK